MIVIASRIINSRGWGGTLHLRVDTESGERVVGQALSSERDPKVMQKRTFSGQAAVADEIGATAADFGPPAAVWVYGLVVRGRTTRLGRVLGGGAAGIGVWRALVPRPAGFYTPGPKPRIARPGPILSIRFQATSLSSSGWLRGRGGRGTLRSRNETLGQSMGGLERCFEPGP
jgi:hypothetical protein